MRHIGIGTFMTVMALGVQTAQADELRLRGGLTSGLQSEYIFGSEDDTGEAFSTDYGAGGMIGLNYFSDEIIAGVGADLGLQAIGVVGDDVLDLGDCDIQTYLGLIRNCHDRVEVGNETAFLDAHALASYTINAGQTQLLGGLSALGFRNALTSDHLFEGGFESFVDRDTEFGGLGVKLGARHQVELSRNMTLKLEGFVGQYRGDREMKISDFETDEGVFNQLREATFTDQIDVTTLEITPSISMAADWAGAGASVEFGVSYKLFQGIADTRNVVSHGEFDAFEGGDQTDDIATTSLFAGLTIPLN